MTKKRRGSLLLRIVVIGIVLFAVVQLIQLNREIDEAKADLAVFETDIERQKHEIDELEKALATEDEDEFISEVAREEYGYAAPDEHIFIDISN